MSTTSIASDREKLCINVPNPVSRLHIKYLSSSITPRGDKAPIRRELDTADNTIDKHSNRRENQQTKKGTKNDIISIHYGSSIAQHHSRRVYKCVLKVDV